MSLDLDHRWTRRRPRRALALGLCLIVAACGGSDRSATPTEPPSNAGPPAESKGGILGTGLGVHLLACTPLPPAGASATIGPAGGTLNIGQHTLVVPPGALASAVVMTADAPSDTVNSVHFDPQGLQFDPAHPAQLTMSYANCSLLGRLLPKRIVYTTDLLEILQVLLSTDDVLRSRVSAPITHFSRYAIAW